MKAAILLPAALVLIVSPAVAGTVTISEVLYDAAGRDDGGTFVELFGPPGFLLTGWSLEGVNGKGGTVTHRVDLSSFAFPADGILVLADRLSGGGTLVGGADHLIDNLDFQNGPDSVRILSAGSVVDAVGYGTFGSGTVFAGEGRPAPGTGPGRSLARLRADLDTGDNLRDFAVLEVPTPGRVAVATPEPATWALLGAGLLALGVREYRRRRRVGKLG